MYKYYLEALLSLLGGMYQEVKLLNYLSILFVSFKELSYCFHGNRTA